MNEVEKKLKFTFLVLMSLLVLAAVSTSNASPAANIAIEPAQVKDVTTGGTFTVNVTIAGVSELYGWQVNVTFNSQVLNMENSVEGPFLKQLNDTIFLKSIDNTAGLAVILATFRPPYGPHGASGNGLLCSITLTVKSQDFSPLQFKEGTKLNTVVGDNIVRITDFTTTDGSFGTATGGALGIPPVLVVGVVIVVAVIVVSAFFWRRRK